MWKQEYAGCSFPALSAGRAAFPQQTSRGKSYVQFIEGTKSPSLARSAWDWLVPLQDQLACPLCPLIQPDSDRLISLGRPGLMLYTIFGLVAVVGGVTKPQGRPASTRLRTMWRHRHALHTGMLGTFTEFWRETLLRICCNPYFLQMWGWSGPNICHPTHICYAFWHFLFTSQIFPIGWLDLHGSI